MKLNNDCVRDILLTLEEICTYDSSFSYDMDNDKPHLLTPYTHDEILYHVNQCRMANLIISMMAVTALISATYHHPGINI